MSLLILNHSAKKIIIATKLEIVNMRKILINLTLLNRLKIYNKFLINNNNKNNYCSSSSSSSNKVKANS